MADLDLNVDLKLRGLQRFRGGVREAEGTLQRFNSSARSLSRDANGRFIGRSSYVDASGRDGRGGGFGAGGSAGGGDDYGKQISKFGSRMSSAGTRMALAGAGTGYALSRLAQPVLDYEKAIVDAVAVTGDAVGDATGKNEERLRGLTRGFTDMGYAAEEVAQAVGYMGMAGMKTDQIMGSMAPTLKLAKAASLDLARTTDLGTDIMTAFSLKSGDVKEANESMTRVADVMTYTFTSSNTTLSLASQSLFKIGNLAVQAGLSLETVAGAVGQLGSAGIKGSEAGTAIRNMLLRLTNPTKQVRDTFKRLRLDIDDVTDAIAKDDLPKALNLLNEAMGKKNLNEAERLKVFGTVFGARAASAGAYLTSQAASGSLGRQIENTRSAAGTVDKIAAKKSASDPAKVAAMKAELEQMQIDLGTKVLPGLLPVAREIVEGLKGMAEYAEKNPQFVAWAAKWLATFAAMSVVGGPAVGIFGSVVKMTGGMISMAAKSRAAMAELSTAGTALGGVGTQAGAVAGSMSKLRAGIGAAPLWLAAAGAAGSLGYYVGTLADDFTGLSSIISGIDVPTLGEKLLGFDGKRTDKRGSGTFTAEEQQEMSALDARIAELKGQTSTPTAEAARIRALTTGDTTGLDAVQKAEAELADAERRKSGIAERARQRQDRENQALKQYQPMITARAQELATMERELSGDAAKWEGMKGRVGGRSRQDRLKTSALADLKLRKAKLESENAVTQEKVERLGVGLKKGEDWRTKAELRFKPLEIKVSDDRVRVNKDAGEFTLGF